LGGHQLADHDLQAERVGPYGYLRDVLQRMIDGHPVSRLDELLPWSWKLADHVKT
jgi:hypothetical protein